MLSNSPSLNYLPSKGRMLHTMAMALVLVSSSQPLPIRQEDSGMNNLPKQGIKIDTLSHKIHTSTELLTPSNHDVPSATPITNIFCFLTVPLIDTVSLIAGLAPQPCQVLYNSRILK